MSTKALERLLDEVKKTNPEWELVDEAMSEVRVIQGAARDWVAHDGLLGPGKMARLDTLMRSIAEVET